MQNKLSGLNTGRKVICLVLKTNTPQKERHPRGGGSITLWSCFTAAGSGALIRVEAEDPNPFQQGYGDLSDPLSSGKMSG